MKGQDRVKEGLVGDTQKRILEAAGKVFAERGFKNATVREICREAGANVAAINYHFGDKKALYRDTLKYWRTVAFEGYPLEDIILISGPPEEKLRRFIKQFAGRLHDKGRTSRFVRLVMRELFDPTDGLDVIVESTMKPMLLLLSSIVGELLGKRPDDKETGLCCVSIVGQIFHFFYAQPVIVRLMKNRKIKSIDVEMSTDHITRFSLAAIKALKKEERGAKK